MDIFPICLSLGIAPILGLPACVGSAVQGGSAGLALLAAAPQVEGKICSQRKALTPVDYKRVGFDKDVMLKGLFDLKQIAVH